MKCPNCQIENPQMKKFCRECGAKFLQICPQCGFEILSSDKFCRECGQELGGKEPAFEREAGTSRTIAICNQKGGVGKTVTAISLSAILAASGLRTLLIDFDPQGHSGLGLGLDIESMERSVYDVLVNGKCPIGEAIVPARPNLEILPSNIDLATAELEMAGLEKRERRLKEVIDDLRDSYEYVVIDCPPSVGILTVNALVASQIVIIPVTPSYLSIHGLSKLMEILDTLKETLFLDVKIFSFITFFEKKLKEAQLQKGKLESTFGQQLLRTVVRKNTKLNEATRKGMSIFEYDRDCPGARDYFDLAHEIVSIGNGQNNTTEIGVLRQSGFAGVSPPANPC